MYRSLLVLFLSVASAHSAVTIASNSLAGTPSAPAKMVVDSAGAILPLGSLVRVGFFTDPGSNDTVIRGKDLSAIESIFTVLGDENTTAGSGTGKITINQVSGNYGGSVANIDVAFLAPNTPLYVWVFNAATAAAADEWAIFHDAAWLSPGDNGSSNLATFQIADGSELLAGEISGNTIRLAPIPEPSVSIFGLVGALVFAFRRRR